MEIYSVHLLGKIDPGIVFLTSVCLKVWDPSRGANQKYLALVCHTHLDSLQFLSGRDAHPIGPDQESRMAHTVQATAQELLGMTVMIVMIVVECSKGI